MARKYRLYAMKITQENISYAISQRFNRITSKYILVYKTGSAGKGAVEIKNSDLKRLTLTDEKWLLTCNITILQEEALRTAPQTAQYLNDMIDKLEIALEEQQRVEVQN